MQNVKQGTFEPFEASAWRVAVVVAQFNRAITDALLESALATAKKYGLSDVEVYKVAGCVEIPAVLAVLKETKKYACLVALGAIIQGETPHFDYVAKIVSEGVLETMKDGLPVGFGVLTCNNVEQATARVHVGGEAMEAALQSARVIETIRTRNK